MSKIRIGLAGLGYWGPNLARNFDELAELTWLSDLSGRTARRFAPRYPGARMTVDFDEMLTDPSLDAVVVATPSSPITTWPGARSWRANTSSWRSPWPSRPLRRKSWSRSGGARARADARTPAPVPPRREEAEGARRRRRLRRRALPVRKPPELREDPPRGERALEPRRSRPLRHPPPRRRRPERVLGARRELPRRGRGRRLLLPRASRPARSPTCTSRGSTRTRSER